MAIKDFFSRTSLMLQILLCLSLLNSCKDDTDMPSPLDEPYVIGFSTQLTKGAPITTASLSNFGVYAYYTQQEDFSPTSTPNFMYNQRVTKAEESWIYAPVRYWPNKPNEKISFFCYAPYATGVYNPTTNPDGNGIVPSPLSTSGTPTFHYTLPEKVENQPDLIVAIPQKNKTKSANPIPLGFQHTLVKIGFKIQGNGEQVTAISLSNMYVSGSLSLDIGADGTDINWTPTGEVSSTAYSAGLTFDLGQDYVTATSTLTNVTAPNGYLLLIPQTLQADTKLTVSFKDETSKEILLSEITPTWSVGGNYSYSLDLSPQEPLLIKDYSLLESSNCYLINPQTNQDVEYRIPIRRVNEFWGATGNATYGSNDLNNVIGENESWTVGLLWQDVQNLVRTGPLNSEGITLSKSSGMGPEDFFVLKVPQTMLASFRGNFVIGITKGGQPPRLAGSYGATSGTILWSWHFWVTDYNPYSTPTALENAQDSGQPWVWGVPNGQLFQYSDGLYNNTASNNNEYGIVTPWTTVYQNKKMMDRYVGAATVGSDEQNKILYYQFGRKDPFPYYRTLYRYNTETVNYTEFSNAVEGPATVAEAVKNPLTFYKINNKKKNGNNGNNGNGNGNGKGNTQKKNNGNNGNNGKNNGKGKEAETDNWCSTTTNELNSSNLIVWQDPAVSTGQGEKSIFDPSPYGFRLPENGTWKGFVDNKGKYVDNLSRFNQEELHYSRSPVAFTYIARYPSIGAINIKTGKVGAERTTNCWSSSAIKNLSAKKNKIETSFEAKRANACTIICIEE